MKTLQLEGWSNMKRIVILTVAMCWAGSAYAGGAPATAVPEIDGLAGLAALSAVGAVVAFIWERRRSRAK